MLEIGKVYENRVGKYQVQFFPSPGMATIRYIESDGAYPVVTVAVETLNRIRQNIEAERKAATPKRRTIIVVNTKAYVSPVELREFVEQLRLVNCSIQLRCSPVRFVTFKHEYRMLTGKEVYEEDKEVFIKDYYKKGVSMRVAFPRTVVPPKGFNVVTPDEQHHHQSSIDSTSLVWELFREGFTLGLNRAKEPK